MQRIAEHLRSLRIDFKRMEAIDGVSLPDNPDALLDRASIACWLSHRSVFIEASKDSIRGSVLVLEDDAMLTASVDWPTFLEETESRMIRSQIDILQLGVLELSKPSLKKRFLLAGLSTFRLVYRYATGELGIYDEREIQFGGRKVILNTFSPGTHCYIISRSAAKRLACLNNPPFIRIEGLLLSIAGSISIRVARLKRSLAGQRDRTLNDVSDTNIGK
jgi:GR25 family glycosyltransferase involved in LPS biosynthesis